MIAPLERQRRDRGAREAVEAKRKARRDFHWWIVRCALVPPLIVLALCLAWWVGYQTGYLAGAAHPIR